MTVAGRLRLRERAGRSLCENRMSAMRPADGDESRHVRDCGRPFTVTSRSAAWFRTRGWAMPTHCLACRATRRAASDHDVFETRACGACGERFTIGPGERAFYESRGLTLPKRCKPCREYKRQERQQADS